MKCFIIQLDLTLLKGPQCGIMKPIPNMGVFAMTWVKKDQKEKNCMLTRK